jgi:hypothetical protein
MPREWREESIPSLQLTSHSSLSEMDRSEPTPWYWFVLAGVSFIPLFGLLPAAACLIYAAIRPTAGRKRLAITAALAVVGTFVLYGSLGYLGFSGRGPFADLRTKQVQPSLQVVIRALEYHRVVHGHYPETLEAVAPDEELSFLRLHLQDPTVLDFPVALVHYVRSPDGRSYDLRSVGADRAPFTSDDILPGVSDQELRRIGLKPVQ